MTVPVESKAVITRQPVKTTTRQRVLDTSAALFNRYGIEAVSIGQISDALSISTGNLTYHFKKKTDLVTAHIATLEELLLTEVDHFPTISKPKEFSEAYVDLMELTLNYRFLFVGSTYILQNDLVEATRYRQLIDSTKKTFIRQVNRLIAEDYMKPIQKPYDAEMLVDSIWWQWLGWMLVTQINLPENRKAERRQLAEAVLHILFLAHHYIDAEFFKAVQAELKKMAR
jgi:AcrR family transcriptional regulator